MTIRLERYDQNSHRLYQDDKLVGFASRLANDRWALLDANDQRLSTRQFATPKAVAVTMETFIRDGRVT